MKTGYYGRVVFGASAVLFGVIALMWYDSDTWQTLQEIWRLPFGKILGGCLMVLQIAGGLGILLRFAIPSASVVLGVVYLLFSLANIPEIIAPPNVYERYGGSFFLFFSLVCGALALFAANETNAARGMALGRLVRLGLGICAISFTIGQALLLLDTASLVPKWIPPNQMFWAVLTTIAFAFAALAILINLKARLAVWLMATMLALFGILVWIPRVIAKPRTHFYWSECVLTFLIAGASWVVFDALSGAAFSIASARGDE